MELKPSVDAPLTTSRRSFLTSAGLAGAALTAPGLLAARDADPSSLPRLARPDGAPQLIAQDESYWQRVAAHYKVSTETTNLEGGFWGPMASPVLAQYLRNLERVNTEHSYYARNAYQKDVAAIRGRIATALGAEDTEIALTRGATESLQCLIGGYNRLKRGDAVLYADLDYPGAQYAMNWLAQRRGVRVARFNIPEPATYETLLAAYERALDDNQDVRLLLLTHINNKTGLVLPVPAIANLARRRGVDVILDAAHSWGQIEISVKELGVDFVAFNLHKWIGAPLGVGAIYIRNSRLADVDRMMSDEDQSADSILSRVHTGTVNFAAVLTVPAALDFHAAIGPALMAARLQYLRNRWVKAVRDLPAVSILTPDDPRLVASISSFRLHAQTSTAANQRIVDELRTQHRLFTNRRSGLASGDCVRVTPALYNRLTDVDRLAGAIGKLASSLQA